MTDSATTLVNSASTSNIATSISEFASSIATKFKTIPTPKLPLPNVLHDYATYNYVLGISVLTDADIADPDNTYFANKSVLRDKETNEIKETSGLRLICKTGNTDPDNRIKTDYGKFDFFVDNLTIDAVIGLQQGYSTNSTTITFTVTEPYSMGLFSMSCQQAAWDAGHGNWREAPFLLTIEFRGNDELGNMALIPTTSRYLPFKWQEISMNVNQNGSIYQCQVFAWNDQALSARNSTLKSDMSIKGSTVQEVLQTGEKSLQAVWNKRLQQLKEDKILDVPDEVIIIFPTSVASNDKGEESQSTEDNTGATTGSASPSDSVYTKLGVTKSTVNNTYVQDPKNCNLIGKAIIGVGTEKTSDAPFGKDNQVYNEETKVAVRANNTPAATETDFRFRQDSTIPNAINQVILQSNFPHGTFDPSSMSDEGYLKWWRIDVQVYNKSTDANYPTTGVKPKIIVYRVVPYNVHNSSAPKNNNEAPAGIAELVNKNVKEYNYLYTGHNYDILSFEIKLANSFSVSMAADAGNRSQDVKEAEKNGLEPAKVNTISLKGSQPDKTTVPTSTSYTDTKSRTDKQGGSGADTAATRAARVFHDAVTRGQDMMTLDMEINGDPFYIAQSGVGNYTSEQTQFPNLNTDGTVNYQNGEVHIIVNFRTPVEINQTTGMYQFSADVPSSPLLQYSGLFRINQLTSYFNQGVFKQHILGNRVDQQENPNEASKSSAFSFDKFTKDGAEMIGKAVNKTGKALSSFFE